MEEELRIEDEKRKNKRRRKNKIVCGDDRREIVIGKLRIGIEEESERDEKERLMSEEIEGRDGIEIGMEKKIEEEK